MGGAPRSREIVLDGARSRVCAAQVERGAALTADDLSAARACRDEWRAEADALFERFDVLALPAAQVDIFPLVGVGCCFAPDVTEALMTRVQAFPFDAALRHPPLPSGAKSDTYHRWMEVVIPVSLLGLPALCVPVGFSKGGLPMGLQLIGRARADAEVLALGHRYACAMGRWSATEPACTLNSQYPY